MLPSTIFTATYLIFLIQKSPFPLVMAFLRNLSQGQRQNGRLSRFTRPVCFYLFEILNFVCLSPNCHNLVSISATMCSSSYDFIILLNALFLCIIIKIPETRKLFIVGKEKSGNTAREAPSQHDECKCE